MESDNQVGSFVIFLWAFEFQIIWIIFNLKYIQNAIVSKSYDPVVVDVKLSHHALMSRDSCEGSQVLGDTQNLSLTSNGYDSFVAPA